MAAACAPAVHATGSAAGAPAGDAPVAADAKSANAAEEPGVAAEVARSARAARGRTRQTDTRSPARPPELRGDLCPFCVCLSCSPQLNCSERRNLRIPKFLIAAELVRVQIIIHVIGLI